MISIEYPGPAVVILYIGLFRRPSYSLLESAMPKPPLELQTTTLWEYPSQHYGDGNQGDKNYVGATPSWIIWNLLQRYTKPKDLVVDPMAGSGTTLDVARDISRRALGYDLQPIRKDIFRADARKLPLEDEKADFVFIDPPYSTHVKYSGLPQCIGELSASEPAYYQAMETVIGEINRILRPDRYMALYVSDSFEKDKAFNPIGFELFARMQEYFEPVDIIAVVRHNAKLKKNNWHTAAAEGNFFLRGFNYLFIMHKPLIATPSKPKRFPDRRMDKEVTPYMESGKPRRNGNKPAWQDRTKQQNRGEKPDRQGDYTKREDFHKQDRQDRPTGGGRRNKPDWKEGSQARGKTYKQNQQDSPKGSDRWERPDRTKDHATGRAKPYRQGRQDNTKGSDRWERPDRTEEHSTGRAKPYRQGRQDNSRGPDRWEKPDWKEDSGGRNKSFRQGKQTKRTGSDQREQSDQGKDTGAFRKSGKPNRQNKPDEKRSLGKPAAKGPRPGPQKAKPGRKPNVQNRKKRP